MAKTKTPKAIDTAISGVRSIELEHLTIESDMQSRVSLTLEAIEEYIEVYRSGESFPPIEVVTDGDRLWVTDGFHRIEAAKRVGLTTIIASVTEGSRADAIWVASASNQKHGVRRTNRDKTRSVAMAMVARPDASNRELAEHCGVSHTFVSACRSKTDAVESLWAAVDVEEDAPVESAELTEVEQRMIDAEKAIKGVMLLIDGLQERVAAIVQSEHGKFIVGQSIANDLANAKSGLKFGIPHVTCPMCDSAGCVTCRESGWVSKRQWDLIPKAQR